MDRRNFTNVDGDAKQIDLRIVIPCAISFVLMVIGITTLVVYPSPIPMIIRVVCIIMTQVGGAVFFPLTFAEIIQRVRTKRHQKVLGTYFSECGRAKLVSFYSNRAADGAQKQLNDAFNNHRHGNIRIIGVSLRAFFSNVGFFHDTIKKNLELYKHNRVHIRAVICDIEKNTELPARSLIEQLIPHGIIPHAPQKKKTKHGVSFQWSEEHKLNIPEYISKYYATYGIDIQKPAMCIMDLKNAEDYFPLAKCLHIRKMMFAPYFTGVIFPGECYYTPNILYGDIPANMPMLVFANGLVYSRILEHFEFCWWSGEDLIRSEV